MDELNELGDSEKWNGDWDTPKGKEIAAKMDQNKQYRRFRNKLLIEIGDTIYAILAVVFCICACLCLLWEMSVLWKSEESLIQYLMTGIHNILNYSPIHLRIFVGVSVILTIIAVVAFIVIPLPLKETD